MSDYYLKEGLAQPVPTDLDKPFWTGLDKDELWLQRCSDCGGWQWGPEWICHHCHSENVTFEQVEATGKIYSYERVWHPVHPALAEQGPYIVVLVEIPHAGDVRLVGNLVGDPKQDVVIGSDVSAVFEHHDDFTLLQWQVSE